MSQPKFHVGDLVRVRHGVTDVDYPDIPMGGWVGRISKVENAYLVRWSVETLENVHPIYRKRCQREGTDIEEYWLSADDLELAPIEPLSMEQPTEIITRPLSMNNQEDRICMAFGLTSDDPLPYDSEAAELTYFNYLKANLSFPFPARFFDPMKSCSRELTVTGMCDAFPVDEGFGVVCEVLDEGEKRQMPLFELKIDPDHPDHQMVDDYITWFVNAPEAETDCDLDEDWDYEFEDDEYEENEDLRSDEDDEEEPRPTTRQKAGRNDPCPCGSGKKFKKCCLGKHRQGD